MNHHAERPNGQVPDNGDDIVAQALSMLNRRTA